MFQEIFKIIVKKLLSRRSTLFIYEIEDNQVRLNIGKPKN